MKSIILLAGEAGSVKQLAESTGWLFILKQLSKNFLSNPLFTCISCPDNWRRRELWNNTSANMNTYNKYIFYWVFLPFPCIFSFYKFWVLPYIVNPIKSYVKFAAFWIYVWWLLQKWFLLSNKLKRSIPGSAGLLNDSMFEDF